MADSLNPVSQHLLSQFELSEKNAGSYQELIEMLSDRIAELLSKNPDFLMSMLYRLDIEEEKVKMALNPENKDLPECSLAKLVVERQKQRMETRQKYSPGSG